MSIAMIICTIDTYIATASYVAIWPVHIASCNCCWLAYL